MHTSRKATLILLAICAPYFLRAQSEEGAPITKFDRFVFEEKAFLSENPASLAFMPDVSISMAEALGRSEQGGLCSVADSPSSLYGGVGTTTYARLGKRLAFRGDLSYSYFHGRKMGGPCFMDPSYNPVNFCETADTTLGVKQRELYGASAALGLSLAPWLGLGLDFSYTSGNQAKRSDPRFRNTWMDMRLNAGLFVQPLHWLGIGIEGIYRKSREDIYSGIYGFLDRNYFILIDYGAGLGVNEAIEGDKNCLSSSSPGRPMINDFYGASIQFALGNKAKWVSRAEYIKREGYYGLSTSNSPCYFNHSGKEFSYKGHIELPFDNSIHIFRFSASSQSLVNIENQFKYTTNEANVTTVEYTGKADRQKRSNKELSAFYEVLLSQTEGIYTWSAGASAASSKTSLLGIIYPFSRAQNSKVMSASLWLQRNFKADESIVSVNAGIFCRSGNGRAFLDDCSEPDVTSSVVRTDNTFVLPQFEYDTAKRLGTSLKAKWHKRVNDHFSFYTIISDSFTTLISDPQYLKGKNRNVLSIGIGCNF